jgi:hypothetical protein
MIFPFMRENGPSLSEQHVLEAFLLVHRRLWLGKRGSAHLEGDFRCQSAPIPANLLFRVDTRPMAYHKAAHADHLPVGAKLDQILFLKPILISGL